MNVFSPLPSHSCSTPGAELQKKEAAEAFDRIHSYGSTPKKQGTSVSATGSEGNISGPKCVCTMRPLREVQGNSDGWHSHSLVCDLQGDPEWDVGISGCLQETGGKARCCWPRLYLFKDSLLMKNCAVVSRRGRAAWWATMWNELKCNKVTQKEEWEYMDSTRDGDSRESQLTVRLARDVWRFSSHPGHLEV